MSCIRGFIPDTTIIITLKSPIPSGASFDQNGGIYRGLRLYSFVDNHDVDRLASKLRQKSHLPLVYALLYFLPGIPSIYYGSEWGIEGRKEGGNDDPLRPALELDQMETNSFGQELFRLDFHACIHSRGASGECKRNVQGADAH